MQTVTMYTGPYCPYCNMAKMLLKQVGVTEIQEISAAAQPAAFAQMCAATGTRTVPQIFIGDVHVGGFDDLSALNRTGKLDDLLQHVL